MINSILDFKFYSKPFDHQRREVFNYGTHEGRGLFWEQGCGKTKPVLDEAHFLYLEKEIDSLLVIAPNGVHSNWVTDEIISHLPPDLIARSLSHIWYSKYTKQELRSFSNCLNHEDFSILVMSYNSVLTDKGRKAWSDFIKQRKPMYVLDEAHRIKESKSKWTKRILGSASKVRYKRVLTGTPVANKPFDVYNPCRFVQEDIWHDLGIKNFTAFKAYFGRWASMNLADGRVIPKCVSYMNMDTLSEKVSQVSTRYLKDDVLDLPDKIYHKRYYQMTSKQRSLYNSLKNELFIELSTGEILTGALAIVRMLRFQQIICGYHPDGDGSPNFIDIEGGNPRLSLLADMVQDLHEPTIIWARFKRDIDLICGKLKGNAIRVDGSVTGEDRTNALNRYRQGDSQFLVANAQAIGTGVTLVNTKNVIYYSNSYNLVDRLQSEDRCHRIGQKDNVNYFDIVCEKSVDEPIIKALREKQEIAAIVTGDKLKDWI